MFIQSILDLLGFTAETSYHFLTQDLEGFAPNVALAMENINAGLQAFSYALLVILTLWNIVRTAGSYVELKRPEHVFKLFMRFILTKYSIAVAWRLVNGIFMIAGALITKVFTTSGLTDGNMWAGITSPNFDNTGARVSLSGLTIGLALIVFSAYCKSPVIYFSGLGIFSVGDICPCTSRPYPYADIGELPPPGSAHRARPGRA